MERNAQVALALGLHHSMDFVRSFRLSSPRLIPEIWRRNMSYLLIGRLFKIIIGSLKSWRTSKGRRIVPANISFEMS